MTATTLPQDDSKQRSLGMTANNAPSGQQTTLPQDDSIYAVVGFASTGATGSTARIGSIKSTPDFFSLRT